MIKKIKKKNNYITGRKKKKQYRATENIFFSVENTRTRSTYKVCTRYHQGSLSNTRNKWKKAQKCHLNINNYMYFNSYESTPERIVSMI